MTPLGVVTDEEAVRICSRVAAARKARSFDWFDGNPPAFDWTHDPEFVSLRDRKLIRRYGFTWWQFTLHCAFHPNQVHPDWRSA